MSKVRALTNKILATVTAELYRLDDGQDKEDIEGLLEDFEETIERYECLLQGTTIFFNEEMTKKDFSEDPNNDEISDTIEDTTEEISDMLRSIGAITLPSTEGVIVNLNFFSHL